MEIFCIYLATVCLGYSVTGAIRDSVIINKLVKVKPVGSSIAKNFVPLTEIPPPEGAKDGLHYHGNRRHLDPDCGGKTIKEVHEGGNVGIFGDYYEDRFAKTVATVIIPDHIDHKHFEVTSPIPYLTVGPIEALGHHPTTVKSEHPSECEKIYQEHVADQYSEETPDYSDESLEMARMPLFENTPSPSQEEAINNMYEDDNM